MQPSALSLPDSIVSHADLARIERELRQIAENDRQAHLVGRAATPAHHMSAELRELALQLSLDAGRASDQDQLLSALSWLKDAAPQVHVSFAAPPTEAAVIQLVRWFRLHANPSTLLKVSVKPSLVGGCVIRTGNKVFNFGFEKLLHAAAPTLQKRVGAL